MLSSAVSALQSGGPHQPCDTTAAAPGTLALERGMHARGPVGSARLRMDLGDLLGQLGISHRTGGASGPERWA